MRLLIVCMYGITSWVSASWAQPPRPAGPPILAPDCKVTPFGCKRQYTYRGKTFLVDSVHKQDGEGLRPIVQAVPQALIELEHYQSNRRGFVTTAYLGTAGIGLALLGGLAKSAVGGSTGETLRQVGLFSGLGLAIGALTYGFIAIQSNESNLQRSVENYNAARPSDQLQLQFSAGLDF